MTVASRDDTVRVDVTKNLSQVVFPASCYSIVNVPASIAEAVALFENLYNNPSQRHIVLAFCRHPKRKTLCSMANLLVVDERTEWSYLDTVHVWYEKPSSSSNSAFLPLTEEAYLFYKGPTPNIANTKWFSGGGDKDPPNATNLWNVSPQAGEKSPFSYYRKFCWEIPLLLASMSVPLEVRRFIYAAEWDSDPNYESLFKFCVEHQMQVQLYAPDLEQAQRAVNRYEEMFGANS